MQEMQVRSWFGKIPWSRKWQPTPVFLPGKFYGQKSLAGYCTGLQTVRPDWVTKHTHTHAWIKHECMHVATSCEALTHWKRPWCWEGLGTWEEDNREWDGWMASSTRCTWVWVNSGCWWWTGRPGVLWFMRLQRVGHDWVTELNWTEWLWRKFETMSNIHPQVLSAIDMFRILS